jgi:hypothetical protein
VSRFLSALALLCALLLGPAAHADEEGTGQIEGYASYEPQTTCHPKPRVGTVVLAEWLKAGLGGGGGATGRSCGGSASEHKDGRAIDWVLDADDPADRSRAKQFLTEAFATDAEGNPQALARRMGIMYVIWSDRFYPAYDEFEQQSYLSSSCRNKKKCSKTLRHRDHMHISLSRAGGRGLTSFYVDLVRVALTR